MSQQFCLLRHDKIICFFSHVAAAWASHHSTMQRLVDYQTIGDSNSTQDFRDSQMAQQYESAWQELCDVFSDIFATPKLNIIRLVTCLLTS